MIAIRKSFRRVLRAGKVFLLQARKVMEEAFFNIMKVDSELLYDSLAFITTFRSRGGNCLQIRFVIDILNSHHFSH